VFFSISIKPGDILINIPSLRAGEASVNDDCGASGF
jgi:hypothetical protein